MARRMARVLAQAKINVWLDVVRPRPDGYHDIFTLFHRIGLADEVTVRVSEERSRALRVTGPRLPAEGLGPSENNLAWRAAAEFQANAGWPSGFSIDLVKHIPVGAGLGGGSADAGAVLRALNAMAPRPFDPEALEAIARSLGADVPFLASETVAAIGAGRGDLLEPLSFALPEASVVLVVPSFAISTADAYRWLREAQAYSRQASLATTEPASEFSHQSMWRVVDHGNTFEKVVEPRFPVIREYRERLLDAGATIARLSGSGSTVFGVFESGAPDARALGVDALVIHTQTAKNVVQVEAQQ